jgi:GT2 family glycosyltransferase/Flp pilus assembly protein TadD
MRASVVIPCHRNVDDTRACLRTLLAQHDAPALELLVVDNASGDGTERLDEEFPSVRILRQASNLGFAGGVNAGLAAAQGDPVLLLNNDTLLAPAMLRRLLDCLASDSRIGLVAPVSNHVKGRARVDVGALGASDEGRARIETALDAHRGALEDVESLAGLCLLGWRRTFARIGAFDERFGLGNFEDDDYSLRARLLGYRLVIARDAFLHHHGHRTFHALKIDYAAQLRAQEQVFRSKWTPDPAARASLAGVASAPCAEDAREGLLLHPAWPDGHWLLARCLLACGERPTALAHLQMFVERCPRHAEAQVALAIEQAASGDRSGGTRRLHWSLAHCHFTSAAAVAALVRFGRCSLIAGRHQEAVDVLERALELEPGDAEANNLLGAALIERGEVAAAVPRLETATGLGHQQAENNLAICRYQLGDEAMALAMWRRAAARGDRLATENLRRLGALSPGDPCAPWLAGRSPVPGPSPSLPASG